MKFNLLLVSSVLLAFSCENSSPEPEKEKDPIIPVNFELITLNSAGNQIGNTASISCIKTSGEAISSYYYDANKKHIKTDPRSCVLVNEHLYISQTSSVYDSSSIYVLDPNTMKEIKNYDLKMDMLPNSLIHLGGDSILISGRANKHSDNVLIANVKSDKFIHRSYALDFSIDQALRVNDKIIVGGYNGSPSDNYLAILDRNNLTATGVKVIDKNMRLLNKNCRFVLDKNNTVWFISMIDYKIKLIGVDINSEKIIHRIDMPSSISWLNELDTAIAIDNSGSTLYVRSKKAFYTFDVTNPTTPDEPVYEYLGQYNLKDLQINEAGNILFMDSDTNNPGELIEVRPNTTSDWEVVKETEIGNRPSHIFLAPYEK